MNFFNDDGFEDIVKEFFGQRHTESNGGQNIIRGEEDERTIDFIDSGRNVFLIFEIPGYSKEDITVNVNKKEIEISVKKKNSKNVQPYLIEKLRQGIYFKKVLPNFINYKKFNFDFKNGILEVVFERK